MTKLMVLIGSYLSRWLVHGKAASLDAELLIANAEDQRSGGLQRTAEDYSEAAGVTA
ncbi:MAG: hypothetical protein JW751_10210 [Polyangiaceae bacterium]|nr:hypothetical protein [Polyangiaceae bacterium]